MKGEPFKRHTLQEVLVVGVGPQLVLSSGYVPGGHTVVNLGMVENMITEKLVPVGDDKIMVFGWYQVAAIPIPSVVKLAFRYSHSYIPYEAELTSGNVVFFGYTASSSAVGMVTHAIFTKDAVHVTLSIHDVQSMTFVRAGL